MGHAQGAKTSKGYCAAEAEDAFRPQTFNAPRAKACADSCCTKAKTQVSHAPRAEARFASGCTDAGALGHTDSVHGAFCGLGNCYCASCQGSSCGASWLRCAEPLALP